jgi:hypothetical protein
MGYCTCSKLTGYDLNKLPDPMSFMADYKLYQDISNAGKKYS